MSSRRRDRSPKPGQRETWGLPSALAGSDHVGRQIARKRREEKLAHEEVQGLPSHQVAPTALPVSPLLEFDNLDQWLQHRNWQPFPFQLETWHHIAQGRSGLLHATTGSGKTYAVWLGVLRHALEQIDTPEAAQPKSGLRALWITPMRALAADTTKALSDATLASGLRWQVGSRTGDTVASERARQTKNLPEVLVTTPESLTLLLAREDAKQVFAALDYVVVDEWHELMGNKRGVQTQLALARLRKWHAGLIVWGLSATLGNIGEALRALLPNVQSSKKLPPLEREGREVVEGVVANPLPESPLPNPPPKGEGIFLAESNAVVVQGATSKQLIIDTLIPDNIERFPWGGHLGVRMVDAVVREIDASATTLVFTNVRSQAEIWYQKLLEARPDWAGLIALHHGSLDKEVREWVEAGLKAGSLKAVVCTSSLDLGVDFLPVERILQIGSAKGVARLMQRAGRSGHAPGRTSRATLVPTNALELIEAAAARRAVAERRIEARQPPHQPYDCLVQHMATVALGGGFQADALFDEITSAYSYRDLPRHAFDWCLRFVEGGGTSLSAYPEYHRIARDEHGVYRMPRADLARRHRMSIGTIVADAAMHVAWFGSGGRLGQIEENFIARLKVGDAFTFSGRILELVRVRDMTAYVRKATRKSGVVPIWAGGRMSLSSELAAASLEALQRFAQADLFELESEPEMEAIRPLLALQQQWSVLPQTGNLVLEQIKSREGHHLFCYPFAGRMVHIGLASLLAWRAARERPGTFSIAMNDYGFELLSAEPFDWQALIDGGLFHSKNLLRDVLDSLNASELAQRRFREIARVAGLVFSGYPGAGKSAKQIQASSGLFYQVFKQHDASNLLLSQAQAEALEQELEIGRLRSALQGMQRMHQRGKLVITHPQRFTPFAFPLMVERFRASVTTEKLGDRIQRLLAELEQAAAKDGNAG